MKKLSFSSFTQSSPLILSCLVLGGLVLGSERASAQVVYSLGVTEIYDDNIFLEDSGTPTPVVATPGVDPTAPLPAQLDGKKNDDLITQAYFSASSALPVQPNFTGSIGGTVGALMFADQSDESRLTLDFDFSLAVASGLLPEHVGIGINSSLTSGSNSVRTAEGTSSRSSENLDNSLNLSYTGVEVAPMTTFGTSYTLTRHDFLGEFLFNESDTRDLSPLTEERGADYLSNAVNITLDRQFTQALTGGIDLGVANYVFSGVESSGLDSGQEPDRTDFSAAITNGYVASKAVSLRSSVGVTLSHLKDEPTPVTVTTVDPTGTSTTALETPSKDNTSLTFDFGVNYAPQAGTSLSTGINQSVGTDIDGKRTLVRTVSLNGAQDLGERLGASLGLAFVQFDEKENLGNSSDRFEASAALTYSITEAISLALGYNYANQNTDSASQELSFGTNDYQVNRAFISLSGGLVGLTN